ncbi:MAG: TolC family protein [Gemmatimonadetes bacterium]|nr:TolC family protein [Gemmatimonadota bacterium]
MHRAQPRTAAPRPTGFVTALFAALLLSLGAVSPAAAQGVPTAPAFMSLEEALELARRHNPTYQATQNDRAVADWGVRAAYGRLIPSASASGSVGWQGTGEQRIGNLTLGDLGVGQQPNYYSSSYSLGLNYTLNGAVLYGLAAAKASRAQTAAAIDQARVDLETQVTLNYLDVLRQKELVELAGQQLERARFNLRLVQGQAEVGTATGLDVNQAEIQVGRAEVGLIQAENAVATATYRLLQVIGLRPSPAVALTTAFEVEAPGWSESELLRLALENNPVLRTRQRGRDLAREGVGSARSAYFPTVSLGLGWSGFTREASNTDFLVAQGQASAAGAFASCQQTNELYSRLADPLPALDCSGFTFTEADRQQLITQNDVFPFDFVRSPPSASLSVSVPIFQGFSRQQQLESAQAQLDDSEYQLRDQEIALQAEVAIRRTQLETAYRSVQLEEQNQTYADEQLRLSREQYRVGLIPFLDLVEAETVKVQADNDLLAAIYAYHDALTNLEAVVGRRLRDD